MCADGERTRICVPADYVKFELPEEDRATYVSIGVDIKDIPKVNDKDFRWVSSLQNSLKLSLQS